MANEYEEHAPIQKSAGDMLIALLNIGKNEDVLDLGCGVGNITRRIRKMTTGKVVGIDPSEGMIKEARKKAWGEEIIFEIKSAEEIDYENSFDVIYANSSFQWFKDPQLAIKNCYKALRKGGRIGIQAPAKKIYSPNFIKTVEMVKENPETKEIFSHFRNPWFFLETEEEYKKLFEGIGFKVTLVKIEKIKTVHTPDEVFNIFLHAASVGYLNQTFYDVQIDKNYIDTFKKIVKASFFAQAGKDGKVLLEFNRVFLVGVKK